MSISISLWNLRYFAWTRRKCSSYFVLLLDIDECSASTSVCDVNADCQNTGGIYGCTCKPGFSGDGQTCIGKTIEKLRRKLPLILLIATSPFGAIGLYIKVLWSHDTIACIVISKLSNALDQGWHSSAYSELFAEKRTDQNINCHFLNPTSNRHKEHKPLCKFQYYLSASFNKYLTHFEFFAVLDKCACKYLNN